MMTGLMPVVAVNEDDDDGGWRMDGCVRAYTHPSGTLGLGHTGLGIGPVCLSTGLNCESWTIAAWLR